MYIISLLYNIFYLKKKILDEIFLTENLKPLYGFLGKIPKTDPKSNIIEIENQRF